MTVNTSAGSTIEIGTTAASGSSDTYVAIAEVTNIGEFGRVYNPIEFSSLSDRNVRKFKGQRNDGNITLQLGRSASDAGQTAATVALDSDADYNFRIKLNDDSETTGATPTTFIFKAKVMSYVTNIGGVDQVVQATISLGIKSGSIVETPAT